MKKDSIITLPHANLRKKSERVHVTSDEIRQLIDDMTSASIDWENSRPHEISAALAAVQINSLQRVVIVRADFDKKENQKFIALINPEIIKKEGETIDDFEGCLSVNGVYGKTPRYDKIRVKAVDIDGNPIRFRAQGFLARVIQHEIDHTNGILFIDHIRDKADAFYYLDEKGELQPLDYDKHIKDKAELWD